MKYVIIGCAFLGAAVMLHRFGDYNVSHRVPVTVQHKFLPAGGYKSSATPVMVLKTDDGIVFDHYVSFATFASYEPGARILLNLRRMDIRQTVYENIVFFFLPVLLFSIGITAIITRTAIYGLSKV